MKNEKYGLEVPFIKEKYPSHGIPGSYTLALDEKEKLIAKDADVIAQHGYIISRYAETIYGGKPIKNLQDALHRFDQLFTYDVDAYKYQKDSLHIPGIKGLFPKLQHMAALDTYTFSYKNRTEKTLYKISKRFYPKIGGEIGHAAKVLANVGAKNMEAGVKIVDITAVLKVTKTSKEALNEEKAFPDSGAKFEEIFTKIPVNRLDSYTQKVLQLIPSTRAYKENYVKVLDAKELALIQRKEALYHFLQYFHNLPEQFVRDPLFLMMYYKKLTENLPEVQVRSFQLAMEMYLRKNLLNLQDMRNIFENKFSIEDIVNKNGNVGDIGTFFSGLQANHLYTQPGFKEKVDSCLVIATCLNSADLSRLPEPLKQRIEEIKKATGNTVNDIDLNSHHYDFKITKEPGYARNHIMFISLDNDKQNFTYISENMLREFQNKLNILFKLQGTTQATAEYAYQLNYYLKLKQKINEIRNFANTDTEKLNEWNTFLYSDLNNRPHTIHIPLFIPITQEIFQPNTALTSRINNIQLSSKNVLQAPDIAQALKDVLNQWHPETKDKAFRETQGVLGESLVQKEEVD